jgi:hypothetical protein
MYAVGIFQLEVRAVILEIGIPLLQLRHSNAIHRFDLGAIVARLYHIPLGPG